MSRTIAVIGANSFAGQDLIDLLLDNPSNQIVGVSRSPLRSAAFSRFRNRDAQRLDFHQLDLNQQMPEVFDLLDSYEPAWIVNFAAQTEVAPSWDRPEDWFRTNCAALAELIGYLRSAPYLRRFLHVSSPEVYGSCRGVVREDTAYHPTTPYATSKAAADMLLSTFRHQFGFPVLTMRPTSLYGPGQQLHKIIPRSVLYILSGKTIPLHGGGHAIRSYIHVRDVSRGALAILERGEIGQLYHLSPEQGVEVRQVVATVAEKLNARFEDVVEIVDDRPGQDAAHVIDSSLARETLDWQPRIRFDDGVDEVISWVQTNEDEFNAESWVYHHRS